MYLLLKWFTYIWDELKLFRNLRNCLHTNLVEYKMESSNLTLNPDSHQLTSDASEENNTKLNYEMMKAERFLC